MHFLADIAGRSHHSRESREGRKCLIRKSEVPELEWQLKPRLARLKHLGLAKQLGPVVSNSEEQVLVRESAIDIAAFANCRDVADQLLSVLVDPEAPFRLRKHAGFALEQIADDQIRMKVKDQVTFPIPGDVDDDLRGYYLALLWPTSLSTAELLPLLSPPVRRNYFGSYRNFIEYKLPRTVSPQGIAAILHWIAKERISFDILGPFGYLPSKISEEHCNPLLPNLGPWL